MVASNWKEDEEVIPAEWKSYWKHIKFLSKEKQIKYEDFDKSRIKSCWSDRLWQKVEGADKLLKFPSWTLAMEKSPSKFFSGIAEWYPNPADLIEKKVIIVAQFKKPRKNALVEISQGMILLAEKRRQNCKLLKRPKEAPNWFEVVMIFNEW